MIAELIRLAERFEREAAELEADGIGDAAYKCGVCFTLRSCARVSRARAAELRGSGEHPR